MSETQTQIQKRIETINAKDVVPAVIEIVASKTLERVKREVENIEQCIRNSIQQLVEGKEMQCGKYTLRTSTTIIAVESVEKVKEVVSNIMYSKFREVFKTLRGIYYNLAQSNMRIMVYTGDKSVAEFVLATIKIDAVDAVIIVYDYELHYVYL